MRTAETAEEWNDKNRVGTEVIVLMDGNQKAALTKTRTGAFENGRRGAEILLEGVPGAYPLTYVYKIEEL